MKTYSRSIYALALLFVAGAFLVGSGQTTSMKPTVATGDIVSIEATRIVLQTKDSLLDVILSDKTEYKRVPPENPVLKAAVASSRDEIAVGDKLLVSGIMADDKKTLPARSVYLMTKSDIAQRRAKDSERWSTRGISGRVSAVDTTTGQIKIDVRGLANSTTVVLSAKEGAKFRRYAPDSVKFGEAKPSAIGEISPGDMLRAVGDRSADGASFAAEEIITGAFRTIVGTVKTVDVAKNEVVISDAQSNKDVTVDLGSASLLKRFPEEMAQRLAAFQGGGGMRPGGAGLAGPRPQGGNIAAGQAGQGGPTARPGTGGPRGGIDDMLERFPNITAADLKPGDVIAVSSTRNNTPERIKAIKLLAGVGPFLQAARAQAAAGGGQRGGAALSLDIPGLDGFGGP